MLIWWKINQNFSEIQICDKNREVGKKFLKNLPKLFPYQKQIAILWQKLLHIQVPPYPEQKQLLIELSFLDQRPEIEEIIEEYLFFRQKSENYLHQLGRTSGLKFKLNNWWKIHLFTNNIVNSIIYWLICCLTFGCLRILYASATYANYVVKNIIWVSQKYKFSLVQKYVLWKNYKFIHKLKTYVL